MRQQRYANRTGTGFSIGDAARTVATSAVLTASIVTLARSGFLSRPFRTPPPHAMDYLHGLAIAGVLAAPAVVGCSVGAWRNSRSSALRTSGALTFALAAALFGAHAFVDVDPLAADVYAVAGTAVALSGAPLAVGFACRTLGSTILLCALPAALFAIGLAVVR